MIDAPYLIPLKLWKNNIGSDDKLKLALIGDYWDGKTTRENFDLLKGYEDFFPSSVAK